MWFVAIQDKMIQSEATIGSAIVEAVDEEAAIRLARPTLESLAEAGRGRCVASAKPVELGRFYRKAWVCP